MAHENHEEILDSLDLLDTVDALEPLGSEDIESYESSDTLLMVHSSELIEPLSATDVIESVRPSDLYALDYDDEVPTRVDGKRPQDRSGSFPPPRVNDADVFYLTKPKRSSLPSLVEADMLFPRSPAPKVVPSAEDTSPPAGTPSREMPSIAPVAMETIERSAPRIAQDRSVHRKYGVAVGALLVAAAVIGGWPTGATPAAAPVVASPAAAQDTQENRVASESVVETLEPVSIVAETTAETRASLTTSRPTTLKPGAVRAEPAAAPEEDVVIDDTAQLSGDFVFPAKAAPAGEKLAPPTPPNDELAAFDRSSASSAMVAGASAAQSCRGEGTPRAMARVSVTFAPNGRVTTAIVDGARFAGSPAAGCIARTFRTLRVSPFSGSAVTVHKTFQF